MSTEHLCDLFGEMSVQVLCTFYNQIIIIIIITVKLYEFLRQFGS